MKHREERTSIDRVTVEIALLQGAVGGRCVVVRGTKSIDGVHYTGILIQGVKLPAEKFGVTTSDLLFLLPPEYPRLPPIGCYMQYKWPTADHHFTLQSHYGAPFLRDEGWYWYCLGLGGGFNRTDWRVNWRPRTPADRGHTLVTLYATARYALSLE
jgi:hypothetical protein